MRGFFPYFGAKWRAAPLYPRPDPALPVVEPFAGSAGYSVRHRVKHAILIDADPVIVSVWEFLLSATRADVLALPDIEPEQTTDDLDIDPGACALIGFWLNRGTATPRKRPSAWMTSGVRPRLFWGPIIRRRIAGQLPAIAGWTVRLGTYRDAPDIDAMWFVDPPYMVAGKHYRKSAVDYADLADFCRTRRGRVIACENHGADWLPFDPLASVKSSRGHSREVVWLSSGAVPSQRMLFGGSDGHNC